MSGQSDYNLLISKLDGFIRKFYWNLILRGAISFLALLLISFLAINTIEYFAHSNSAARITIFYGFLMLNFAGLVFWLGIPFAKLNRIGKIISHNQAASIIGKHFPHVSDKLLNTLQLKDSHISGSSALIEASIAQKVNELKPISFNLAIDFKKNKKYLKYALIPLLILAALLIQMPDVVLQSSARILSYNQEFEPLAPFTFNLKNKKLEALMHEDFKVELNFTGSEIPENAYIQINGSEYRMTRDGKADFHYTIKNLDQSKELSFKAAGFGSNNYQLKVLPKPFLKGFETILEFPTYLHRKSENLKNIGDLNIPQGTKVTWKFNTENTDNIAFNFSNELVNATRRSESNFEFSKAISQSQLYYIKSQNEYVVSDSIAYELAVIPDASPSIQVEMTQDSTSLKTYFFQGQIADDYGLSSLRFYYRFSKSENPQKVMNKYQSEAIGINRKSLQSFFHFWDLKKNNYEAGDELEFYFQVWDNDGVNGSKSSKSKVFTIKAPDKKEIEEMVEESSSNIKDDMKTLMQEAQKMQQEVQDVKNRMMNKKVLNWEDKQAINELLEKQKNLEKSVENMNNDYMEMLKNQDEFKKMDEKIRQKHELLQELFEKLMTEEMKELYNELQKMLEQNQSEMQDELDNMEMQSEELEKELDIALEHFKQLELEQKLEETIEKLGELKEKQDDLNNETENGDSDPEELKEKQEALNREFEEIEKDIEEIDKKNQELEEPNKMEDTKQEQQDVKDEMKESSESLGKKKKKKAGESQKKASENIEKLKKKMDSMKSDMESENTAEDLQSLRQILENLLHLSFEQEKLMDELKEIHNYNPRYVELAQHQIQLQNDAQIIEDSLTALSKRVIQISSFINKEVNEMNYNMGKTLGHMSNRNIPQSRKYQQQTMTHVNNLAVMLSEVMQQMQEQMAQEQEGQQQCEKPGESEGKKGKKKKGNSSKLGDMRKMQEKMNEQLKGMKQRQGQGQQLMSKELAKMAAQQQALRKALQEMNEAKEAGGDKPSNELKELQELMDKTEEDLVNKRIDNETMQRQEEIVTRLLEAENAEKEQEFDNKRESITAQEITDPSQKAFEAYKKARMKEIELLNSVPTELNGYYKEKVKQYFEKLEK